MGAGGEIGHGVIAIRIRVGVFGAVADEHILHALAAIGDAAGERLASGIADRDDEMPARVSREPLGNKRPGNTRAEDHACPVRVCCIVRTVTD